MFLYEDRYIRIDFIAEHSMPSGTGYRFYIKMHKIPAKIKSREGKLPSLLAQQFSYFSFLSGASSAPFAFFLVRSETTIIVRKLKGTEMIAGLSIGMGALTFTRW